MSDDDFSDLFDAEPANSYKPKPNPKDFFAGFEPIEITPDLMVALPADLWMSVFSLLSIEPHQVWWRILSEVSKHINHSLKLYFKRIQFTRFNSSATIAEYLACEGYLNCLKYVHEHGARWDVTTCISAASNGHLSCLKFARDNGCEWNELTCYYSALHNHIDCLIYAREQDCQWDYTTIFAAVKNDNLTCLQYCYEHGCQRKPDTTNNYYYDTNRQNVMSIAASHGSLECLKYLHEQGEHWDEDLIPIMAKFGHLNCIQYAIQNGCTYNKDTICSSAADDLECLIYFHERGDPWHNASSDAAQHGNIECLKYIHEHGGQWMGDEIIKSFRYAHLECLKYAFENGCPVPPNLCLHRRGFSDSPEALEYVHSKVECTCLPYVFN